MDNLSRFDTLTKRHLQIQETAKKFIFDLQQMVQLLDANISIEEERTGVVDVTKPDYSTVARQLRARRDNLKATIFRLEGIGSIPFSGEYHQCPVGHSPRPSHGSVASAITS